jgi:hypothetical protein
VTPYDRELLARYMSLATRISTVDRSAGKKLADTVIESLGWHSDHEQAEALRALAIAMTEIAIAFRDRADDLDRLVIDAYPNPPALPSQG